MSKYFASFSANNGSTYMPKAWEYTNKAHAIADIRSSCMEHHFQQAHNRSRWSVTDESGNIIASGEIHGFGSYVRTI